MNRQHTFRWPKQRIPTAFYELISLNLLQIYHYFYGCQEKFRKIFTFLLKYLKTAHPSGKIPGRNEGFFKPSAAAKKRRACTYRKYYPWYGPPNRDDYPLRLLRKRWLGRRGPYRKWPHNLWILLRFRHPCNSQRQGPGRQGWPLERYRRQSRKTPRTNVHQTDSTRYQFHKQATPKGPLFLFRYQKRRNNPLRLKKVRACRAKASYTKRKTRPGKSRFQILVRKCKEFLLWLRVPYQRKAL